MNWYRETGRGCWNRNSYDRYRFIYYSKIIRDNVYMRSHCMDWSLRHVVWVISIINSNINRYMANIYKYIFRYGRYKVKLVISRNIIKIIKSNFRRVRHPGLFRLFNHLHLLIYIIFCINIFNFYVLIYFRVYFRVILNKLYERKLLIIIW